MSRPLLLDLFCGAGGAAAGYAAAGFDIVGVDIEPQPNYPFEFVQDDALDYLTAHGDKFNAVHASPPCQAWSPLNAYNKRVYPQLISPTREILKTLSVPYAIENVAAARSELIDPIILCGPMFGLKLYRHRLFESSFPIIVPPHPEHILVCTRNGYLPSRDRPFMTITGGKHSKAWQRAAAIAMGMPWAETVREICEAIPPAYTAHIGSQLIATMEVADDR